MAELPLAQTHAQERKPPTLDYATPRPGVRRPYFWVGLFVAAIGLMVVGGLLIEALTPSGGRAREPVNRIKCASNLRQLGQALLIYANAHGGQYPDSLETLIIEPDIGLTADHFLCYSSGDERPNYPNYTTPQELAQKLSSRGRPDTYATAPSRPWMHLSYIYCASGLTTSAPADAILMYEPLCNHNNDGINVLFADGHVEFNSRQESAAIVAELQSGHNPPRKRLLGR